MRSIFRMMGHVSILFSLLAVVLLCGCSRNDVRVSRNTEGNEDITISMTDEAQTEMNQDDEFLFGYNTESDDMSVFVYEGKPLSIPFTLENKSATGHDVGFLVFINGILQSYSVEFADGSVSDESTMQKFDLTEIGEQFFNILVNPNVGKEGEKLGLYICSIVYPSFIPESMDEPSYQYYHHLGQVVPQQVLYNTDAEGKSYSAKLTEDGLELPEDIINSAEFFSSDSVENVLNGNLYVSLYQNTSDESVYTAEDGTVTLHLQLYGGVDGLYRTTIFVNNQPVTVEGMDYVESELQKNTMSECEITLDVSELDQLNTVYAVTVPADAAYLDNMEVIKTKSVLLINDFADHKE